MKYMTAHRISSISTAVSRGPEVDNNTLERLHASLGGAGEYCWGEECLEQPAATVDGWKSGMALFHFAIQSGKSLLVILFLRPWSSLQGQKWHSFLCFILIWVKQASFQHHSLINVNGFKCDATKLDLRFNNKSLVSVHICDTWWQRWEKKVKNTKQLRKHVKWDYILQDSSCLDIFRIFLYLTIK